MLLYIWLQISNVCMEANISVACQLWFYLFIWFTLSESTKRDKLGTSVSSRLIRWDSDFYWLFWGDPTFWKWALMCPHPNFYLNIFDLGQCCFSALVSIMSVHCWNKQLYQSWCVAKTQNPVLGTECSGQFKHTVKAALGLNTHVLTSGGFVTVVSVSEVLWILYDGDPCHPYHHSIRTRIQGTGADNTMVDVMKGTCRILLTTYHCYRP